MTKTDKYKSGVIGVTSLARTVNPEIGSYQEHFITDNFGFAVKLYNGAINMSMEVAQDYEAQPSSATTDRIENVAKTFRKI
ncbi:MAG: hypothetical protein H6Q15_2296 [Bacteroidetes bacterium]|nr:hypothetical protein [Bacteroidota bacterium]